MTASTDQSVLRYVSGDATPMTYDGLPTCAACKQRFPEGDGYYVSVLNGMFCLDCGAWLHEHGHEQMRRRVDPAEPDGGLADRTIGEICQVVAAAVWAWVGCPCQVHAFDIGVTAGAVTGSTWSVVRTAVAILHDRLDAGELDLPEGVNDLRLRLVLPTMFPDGPGAVRP